MMTMMTMMTTMLLLLLDKLRLNTRTSVEAVVAIDGAVARRLGRHGGGGTVELGESSINWTWS